MKYDTQTNSERQNTAFNRKLNHLTGTIGLANWTFSTPTDEDIKAHHNNAHVLRANAIHRAAKATNNAIKNLARNLYHRIRLHYRVKSTIQQLDQLEDHRLDDIGIERSAIATFARKQTQQSGLAKPNQCAETVVIRQNSNSTRCQEKPSHKNCANDSYRLIDSACG